MKTDPLDAARRHFAAAGSPAWLVGGRVRDALMGRASLDTDVVVPGGALDHARTIARAHGAAFVPLDPARGYARVVWAGVERIILDITDFQAADLASDLRARDFTVNALALPLGASWPPARADIVDPTGGLDDLAAGRLRAPSAAAFDEDPLRLLRGVRLAATLGLALDPPTRAAMAARASMAARPAGERVREELLRTLAAAEPSAAVGDLAALGLLAVVLPEAMAGLDDGLPALGRLARWQQALEADVGRADLPEAMRRHASALAAHDAAPVESGFAPRVWGRLALLVAAGALGGGTRGGAAAVAGAAAPGAGPGPARRARRGAEAAAARLRLGRAEAARVATVARLAAATCAAATGDGHAAARATSRRRIYRYFRSGGPCGVDAGLVALALSEGLAPGRDAASERPAEPLVIIVGARLDAWFERRAAWLDPAPALDGGALMELLGLAPGPIVGRLLAGLREAQAVGEVTTRAAAEAWARARAAREGMGGSPDE